MDDTVSYQDSDKYKSRFEEQTGEMTASEWSRVKDRVCTQPVDFCYYFRALTNLGRKDNIDIERVDE